ERAVLVRRVLHVRCGHRRVPALRDRGIMTFGDAIAAGLPRLREYAERLMVDEVEIGRPTGAVDPITGETVLDPVYAGKAKVQTYEGYEQDREIGGGSMTTQRYRVDLPVGAYAARVDDVVTVKRATFDPN